MSRFLLKPPTVRSAAAVIVSTTAAIVVVSGIAISFVDRKDFPNIWIGMWWALQTVTTVGYGDVVPHTVVGRVIGSIVLLEGVAFIAVVTAAITSTFVARAAREYENIRPGYELSDRQVLEKRLDDLDQKLDQLLTERAASSSTSTSGSSDGS